MVTFPGEATRGKTNCRLTVRGSRRRTDRPGGTGQTGGPPPGCAARDLLPSEEEPPSNVGAGKNPAVQPQRTGQRGRNREEADREVKGSTRACQEKVCAWH